MRMPIKNSFIGVSADFLANLPHLSSRVAAVILLPLTQVKHKESWNDNEVGIFKDELFDIMKLSKGYNHSGKFNALLRELLDKAKTVTVDGLQIIEHYDLDYDSVYVTYSKSAFDRFFQRLGLVDKKTKKATRYFTFLSDDIGSLSKLYSWDVYKSMLLNSNTEDAWTTWTINTRDFRKLTGMEESDYLRPDGSTDRTNLEKKALAPALEEIAGITGLKLYYQEKKLDKNGNPKYCYFRKEFYKLGCSTKRNPVKFYEVKLKKYSIKSIKSKINFKEETNYEEEFYYYEQNV